MQNPRPPDDPGSEPYSPDIKRRDFAFMWIGIACVLVLAIIMLVLASRDGRANERPAASPDGAWFKSLRQNTTGASCCDISDCRKTTADWDGSQWIAEVEGEQTPIPNDKVLKNKFAADGEAYVCSGYGRKIFCFVPKNMGF